jgi:hypothetical protein
MLNPPLSFQTLLPLYYNTSAAEQLMNKTTSQLLEARANFKPMDLFGSENKGTTATMLTKTYNLGSVIRVLEVFYENVCCVDGAPVNLEIFTCPVRNVLLGRTF